MTHIPAVTVVGAVNLDIGGRSHRPPVMGDSNPGAVRTAMGGVGRNIAHNLALLGVDTGLLTAYGDDDAAGRIRASCRALGIDDSLSCVLPGQRTSTYLFLSDQKGDMVLAVNDMDIYRCLTPALLAPRMEALNRGQAVVLDANLPAESILYLAEHCTVPLSADPVSYAKASKLLPVLGRIHTLKPNRLEAELLSGVTISDEESLCRAASALLAAGVKKLFISLGADGVLAADNTRQVHLPVLDAAPVNTTGCGDAFMAAAVWAQLRGLPLDAAAKAGLAAAAITAEQDQAIHPSLCTAAVLRRAAL